jgi:TonB-dependent receptor
MFPLSIRRGACAIACAVPAVLSAQSVTRGRVTDPSGRPLEGAIVSSGAARATLTDKNGNFTLATPAGGWVRATLIGFAPDSMRVMPGEMTIALAAKQTALTAVRVEAQRAQGTALSLSRQKVAENLKVLTVAEEIRALPNANAADAISRLPGVSLQRHEGEGSYVQVRGIDGNLSNITINGAHVAGNFDDKGGGGSRLAKLDGVPAELLSVAQVSKTLTPDLDADAIGGSVNIDTKTAHDAPGLTLVGSWGRSDLQRAPQGQGSVSYGGTMGSRKQFSFFGGGSYDRNNRVYDDVEPNYDYATLANGQKVIVPLNTSKREYFTERKRTGAAFHTEYQWDDQTSLALKGMWSRFDDGAIRYRQDVRMPAIGNVIATSPTTGTGNGGRVTSNVAQRTPVDQNYMIGLSGRAQPGRVLLDYAATGTQTELVRINAGDITFTQTGIAMTYDRSDPLLPVIAPASGVYPNDPSKYAAPAYTIANQWARGRDVAGIVNAQIPLHTEQPSALKFGVKLRQERRYFDDKSSAYSLNAGQTFTMAEVASTFTNPNHFWGHYPLYVAPDAKKNELYYVQNPQKFTRTADGDLTAKLNIYDGTERIAAGYGSYSVDLGAYHWLVGARVEQTHTTYTANKAVTNAAKVTTTSPVSGSGDYTNIFPSAQLRVTLDEKTNLRFAVSTSIGRPLYYDLAPHTSVTQGALATDPNAVSLGNPDLKPTTSINYDVMWEHFSSDVGIISLGGFYKSVTNFIYQQNFTYSGAPFDGYNATQPKNGKGGTIYGLEGALVERFAYLPGVFSGLGFDANATYTQSRSDIPGREGKPFPRQANWNGNASLTFASGKFSSRLTMQYNGPYIYTLGDGSENVKNGDTYMMAHQQFDASLNYQVMRNAQIVLQALNINNAPFGYYFAGDPNAIKQRELYGSTTSLQFRINY